MNITTSSQQRALVVGLGVSGIASALRLHQAGWDVVVLEKSPERRTGGYFIGLFGTGLAAAGRLGIELPDRVSDDLANYSVDRAGHRKRALNFADAVPGRTRLVVRGDIEDAAFAALPADVEIRYASAPAAIRQDGNGVEVDIEDRAAGTTATERFDLVVGADGLRSTVRRLAFGPDEGRLHRLGYMLAACSLPSAVPGFRPRDGVVLAEAARSAWVFPFADRPPTVLFNYRTENADAEFDRPAIERLRSAFGPEPSGPVLGWLLDQFEQAPDHLFDTAEQVRLDHWHQGRVVLAGDAAWCLTLYSGMGASTGMAGADLLGTMIERHPGDLTGALRAWEAKLRPFVEFHQDTGMAMRALFVPADAEEMRMRRVFNRIAGTRLGRSVLSRRQHRSEAARMKTLDIASA
ncbi:MULTISPECIES: FAD-dependent monooxygenase [Glycomyces]|uniref:2-polyprenyl-6-methoxyphenol hydroxylase-like FAD-dependent oxidoreductase n=2 Tax=Glycomyces TaxID=58113 RepID=A0A9X3PR15_9ACTN|nr:FAD-dependent monooxygenase [Glycomyces lechevalierae]MDA1388248.1 FAD-dependent monooxygenase [Glycomyces lechevalierae]MDR7337310.1 2-polyprenyl-6-methoxyphenol hydroxylase-like FAD-dependent oxidoreductase [Glycomyces lechevalierae]